MGTKNYGTCSLCGKYGRLTYEHIPPKSSFNSKPVYAVSGDALIKSKNREPWNLKGLPYTNLQKGMGKYSLCRECNNNTGAWYGNEYVRVSDAAHLAITEKAQGFGIKDFYPLRFIKQVLSMFCSVNPLDDGRIIPLRSFVLGKELHGLDKQKYKLCMYFTKSKLAKQNGISVVGNILNKEFIALSEITSYPMGFILYFDPSESRDYVGFDITDFSNYSYDSCGEVRFPLLLLDVNTWIPEDYRTKKEVLVTIDKSERWEQEHGLSQKEMG